jgi:hypothetical protein
MKSILIVLVVFCYCTPPTKIDTTDFQKFIENFDPSAGLQSEDLSTEAFNNEVMWLKEQLDILNSFDTSQLEFNQRIDWRFAKSILSGKLIRQTMHQSWKKDPRIYMQFRSIANVIGQPGDVEEKSMLLKEKLELVPAQLNNGRNQLEIHIPRFRELSLFMANNAIELFGKEIPDFFSNQDESGQIEELIVNAQSALDSYIEFLESELMEKPQGEFMMGKEAYNQMLAQEFLLDYDDESLFEFGKKRFEETLSDLDSLALIIDSTKTWQELAVEIKNDYPDPSNMIEAHQYWVDSSKAHILKKGLIPIPWDEQVLVVPRAEYLRKTSYYGNFSRARYKDEDSVFTAKWMINPFEDQWDDKVKQEYLSEHDWGVIIVTAPHEAYGGHHVQGLYQMHNPRKLRRENGLSLFSEGWGLYNEQLMSETGFFPNDQIQLRQLQLRLWRNARVIYDVGLHSGKMSYEEAISLMTDQVGFLHWAAQLEIDAAAARPGYFIGYFIGMTEILKMREQYRLKMGSEYSLSDFHEKLLKIGNMPPSLMAKVLLSE